LASDLTLAENVESNSQIAFVPFDGLNLQYQGNASTKFVGWVAGKPEYFRWIENVTFSNLSQGVINMLSVKNYETGQPTLTIEYRINLTNRLIFDITTGRTLGFTGRFLTPSLSSMLDVGDSIPITYFIHEKTDDDWEFERTINAEAKIIGITTFAGSECWIAQTKVHISIGSVFQGIPGYYDIKETNYYEKQTGLLFFSEGKFEYSPPHASYYSLYSYEEKIVRSNLFTKINPEANLKIVNLYDSLQARRFFEIIRHPEGHYPAHVLINVFVSPNPFDIKEARVHIRQNECAQTIKLEKNNLGYFSTEFSGIKPLSLKYLEDLGTNMMEKIAKSSDFDFPPSWNSANPEELIVEVDEITIIFWDESEFHINRQEKIPTLIDALETKITGVSFREDIITSVETIEIMFYAMLGFYIIFIPLNIFLFYRHRSTKK
jgi:hypothetical protein